MMDRRTFLTSLPMLFEPFAIDLDQLLWVPTKTIFIPSETVLFDRITAATLRSLREDLIVRDLFFVENTLYRRFCSNRVAVYEGGTMIGGVYGT